MNRSRTSVLTEISFPQRSVLLQLYSSSQEDTEVRIAAYQQLMRCSDLGVFEVVKTTLRSETSSQGGVCGRDGRNSFCYQKCLMVENRKIVKCWTNSRIFGGH